MADGGAIARILAIFAEEASPVFPISNGLRPGLAMPVESFADQPGLRNIRVDALLPNLFATDRVKTVLGEGPAPVAGVFLGRIGKPAESGRIATVLLSPVASDVTGAAIFTDGGQARSL